MKNGKTWLMGLCASLLSGCATNNAKHWLPPQFVRATPSSQTLLSLPPPDKKLAVAVYGFTDQTGQFKNTETVQTLSRAVTQGGTSVLVKALQDAGNRQWFQIIERERLDDLLRERAVIREMRQAYLGEQTLNTKALPPLLFAGVLLEGGVIGYDSNIKTGGLGARYLGIGANVNYREDNVTVYLRAVSTKTGEVLVSVNSRKSVSSVLIASNTFRFIGFQDLLEVDAGGTTNEPTQLALQQAIEKAVYGLIMEGAEQRLWCFQAPPDVTSDLLRHHLAERDHIKLAEVRLPLDASGNPVTGSCSSANAQAAAANLQTGAPSILLAPAPGTVSGQAVASTGPATLSAYLPKTPGPVAGPVAGLPPGPTVALVQAAAAGNLSQALTAGSASTAGAGPAAFSPLTAPLISPVPPLAAAAIATPVITSTGQPTAPANSEEKSEFGGVQHP